ncbi:MAG: hypothetical protein HC835_21550 [Oscillatoriales cyanobacterium RM2_1_1]|nr:hypothetical protein [Oscillatoriales cyanobacterium SM2_3_0]NJO47971.1 hypothetical protein [Oscillatoriales cyanobacterium RM2_1_1]
MLKFEDLKPRLFSWMEVLILGTSFGISYVQRPLYTSNQNTKFLHGFAKAGVGYLNQDWLANTIDPLPTFTGLVQFTSVVFSPGCFYLYYLILAGIYTYSLIGIISRLYQFSYPGNYPVKKLVYFVAFITIHCLQVTIFGFETHTYLSSGVAEQYILGDYFQTSNFGAIILLSIDGFLRGHSRLAILGLAGAATLHPAYLPTAALLTLSYMVSLARQGNRPRKVLGIGVLALGLVLPIVLYSVWVMQPTSPATSELAQSLIVDRIAHHASPKIWLDRNAWIQILITFVGVFLVRKTRLLIILGIPLLIAVVSTALAIVAQNNLIAFLTPWRVSAILVPLSTSIILGYLLNLGFQRWESQLFQFRCLISFTCLIILSIYGFIGANQQIKELNAQKNYAPMMEFVRTHKLPSDLYLVPHTSGNFIEFRLATGAPILANYKSHPYRDTEVIEWHNRLMLAQRFYAPEFKETRCQTLTEIQQNYQITHLITEQGQWADCPGLQIIYQDERYTIYQLVKPE